MGYYLIGASLTEVGDPNTMMLTGVIGFMAFGVVRGQFFSGYSDEFC
jgi:hypothetical protein